MQHFVDETIITVQSGDGGRGCVSFRREKFIPYGGPDGGDGGDGGDVIFVVKKNLRTLYHLKLKRTFKAKNGSPGEGNQKTGKKGENVIIEVPPGTVIYNYETGELIKDFKENDEPFILLKGGKGGKGNAYFKSSTNQSPRYAQPGLPGKKLTLKVELKLIADIGLVGFPNAGKSTLLSVLTKAKPKIANYPFTTLVPNLGVFFIDDESYVIADIPGLIEGASKGAGLGIKFLKHIERTKIILYLIDLENENYLEQFDKLRFELKNYSDSLYNKPYLVAASKYDLIESKEKFEKLKEKLNNIEKIYPFSSITKEGLNELLYRLKLKIEQIENEKAK